MTKILEKSDKYRVETDSLGPVNIPEKALWGAQTQRAIENFPISGWRFQREFIRALGIVKIAAARANMRLGLLDKPIGAPIVLAAREVMEGKWDDQFVVDIFQTGSGTSTHMNANELIANRAKQIAVEENGNVIPIHAHDHVNLSQSSNDVMPSCLHIAAYEGIKFHLLPILDNMSRELELKAVEFRDIIKLGRTHLQDATPVRLGREFRGFAVMIQHDMQRLEKCLDSLSELALGGTAVGTGMNTHPEYARLAIAVISEISGGHFREAEEYLEAQGSRDAIVETSGALKVLAVSLMKIANDIRWMGAGPYGNIGELTIPTVQPGSSMMPGKINPVMAESLMQAAVQAIGCDAAITLGGLSGNFELNVMLPVITYNFLSSVKILTNAADAFTRKCIKGLKANRRRCEELVEKSLAMATALSPILGYEATAKIAQEAFETGQTIRQIVISKKILPEDKVNELLNPTSMTKPGLPH